MLVVLANSRLMPQPFRNGRTGNLLALAVLGIVLLLALTKLAKLLA